MQAEKARFAGNIEIANQICATEDPAKCKSLGSRVTVDENQWLPVAQDAVKKACRIKFAKNAMAREYLINSQNTKICEAGPDKVWGVGLTLYDPKIHEENEWQGTNYLGKILEVIRNEL